MVRAPEASETTTPESVYVEPNSTERVVFPVKTGIIVSTTLTVLVAVEVFPEPSVAV